MAERAMSVDRSRGLSAGRSANQAALHIVLILFSILAVGPSVWMIFGSFKQYKELVQSRDLLPHVWTLDNYTQIIGRVNFPQAALNSVIIAVVTTVAVLFTSSTMGYIFAKYRFPFKEQFFALILATMMVPFAVVLVPLYIFIADIGASDHITG